MSWRTGTAAAVTSLVVAAALLTASQAGPQPAATSARARLVPVTATALACPGAAGDETPGMQVLAVGPAPTGSAAEPGRLAVTSFPASAGSAVTGGSTSTPGQAVSLSLGAAAQSSLRVSASGALAPGAAGAQLAAYSGDQVQGIAAAWCERPRTDWWFEGVDTSVGTTTDLVLSNPRRETAVVDLTFLGPGGSVDAAGSSGIAIAAGSRTVLDLARFAPGRTALSVRVSATSGTVAAAISTSRLAGLSPDGVDWVPASAPPARRVVVDAGVAGAAKQSLVVVNPGMRERRVAVRVLSAQGGFTPTGLSAISVPPQSVVVRDISSIVSAHANALSLSSGAPVTGAIVSDAGDPSRDFAVSGVGPVLRRPAVVPVFSGTTMSVAFTTQTPAPVRLTAREVAADGTSIGSTTLTLTGDTTTSWTPPTPGTGTPAYLVLTLARGGRLSAVATYVVQSPAGKTKKGGQQGSSTTAEGIAQLTIQSGDWVRLRPAVVP